MNKKLKSAFLTTIATVSLATTAVILPMENKKTLVPVAFATIMAIGKYGLNQMNKSINHYTGKANAMPVFNDSFGHNACNFVVHLAVGSMLYKAFFSK